MISPEELSDLRLFAGIAPGELRGLLGCMGARVARFHKDDLLVEEGAPIGEFGVLLAGRARSVRWDASGREIILTLLGRGGEYGVLMAARPDMPSPVSVQAEDDVAALLIPFCRLVSRCARGCACHERLLENYIAVVADKGLELHERINCLLRPSTREKILAYLNRVSREQGDGTLTLPLSRGGMAAYLNTDRSALSRELSAMRRDGLIEYHKNVFRLLSSCSTKKR